MPDIIPLHLINSGTAAHVVDVVGQADQIQRVRELGFHNGAQLEMVKSGSPCIVKLSGNTLSLRTNELLNIFVRPAFSVRSVII
jgi:ferrous iron transport protein A